MIQYEDITQDDSSFGKSKHVIGPLWEPTSQGFPVPKKRFPIISARI